MAGRRRALGLALGALACAAIGSVAWLGAPRAPDHELALASPPSTECYSVAGGVDYHGTLNETRGGAACEAWPPSFAQFGYSGHNFCRAPPTIRTGCAWCFTNLAASAWACCKLPAAQPSCAREASEADVPHALVPGTLGPARPAVLISRAPPPPALSPPPAARALPTPASHEPAASGAHAPLSGARLAECFVRSDGSDYRGKVNTTAWGNTCQRWSAQTPHAHEFEPDRYPNDGLVANYCRRPGRRGPHCAWCYTVEETKHGYDCCDIGQPQVQCTGRPAPSPPPSPPPSTRPGQSGQQPSGAHDFSIPAEPGDCCYTSHDASDYRGQVNHTVWGFACQRWDAQTPTQHSFYPWRYPDDGLDENYCRRPGGQGSHCAWCYIVPKPNSHFKHETDCCDVGQPQPASPLPPWALSGSPPPPPPTPHHAVAAASAPAPKPRGFHFPFFNLGGHKLAAESSAAREGASVAGAHAPSARGLLIAAALAVLGAAGAVARLGLARRARASVREATSLRGSGGRVRGLGEAALPGAIAAAAATGDRRLTSTAAML